MKRFYFPLFVIIILNLFACNQTSSKDLTKVIGQPADYFPTNTGCKWEYEIIIGDVEPLQYRITHWPIGKKIMSRSTRSRFIKLVRQNNPNSRFSLILSVKGPVEKAGPYAWSPVELKIERDDLGIYEDVKSVFLVHTADYSLSMEVLIFSSDSTSAISGAWGGWMAEDGYSSHLIFFASKPNIQKSFTDSDTLLFLGLDEKKLHYRREVKEKDDKKNISILNMGFTEDLWFAKNKGLVKLEQKINGKVSMTWRLVKFTKKTIY